MALINDLMNISEQDLRHNFTDFYFSFDLDNFYSRPTINAIMTGKKDDPNFNNFLSKCLKIYKLHTKNYNSKTKTLEKEFKQYNMSHMIPITYEKLACSLGSDSTTVARVIRANTSSKLANNILDVLEMNLFNMQRSAETIFNNISAYIEITRRIMRAEIGNGIEVQSLEQVSKNSHIDIDNLKHPESLCKDDMLYLDSYQKLVNIQKNYEI